MRKNAKKAAKTRKSASTAPSIHPSHETRSSDASRFDTVCDKCGRTDEVPGGAGQLALPCPAVKMKDYIICATASWVQWNEKQQGGGDESETKTAELFERFEAPNLEEARVKAKKLLAEFEKDLPKKREGGLSWQNEDAQIISITFSEVHKL